VKRFLKVLTLLVLALFALVSGVDRALDKMAQSPTQSSFTWYNEHGDVVATYSGDLALVKASTKPTITIIPSFLHRTSTRDSSLPVTSEPANSWF
jgi:hypothetical protein